MRQLEKGIYLGTTEKKYELSLFNISEISYYDKVFEGWHCHQNSHITFLLAGGNREQRKKREFESTPGNIVLYNSGELHRNYNTLHPSKNINIEIDKNFFLQYQVNLSSFPPGLSDSPSTKFVTLQIYHELRSNDKFSEESINALLLNLLSGIPPYKEEKVNPKWVQQVKTILNDRWNETVSLAELASLVQVHPVTISKFFPKYFFCSLGDYCRNIRVDKAIGLIRNSSLSLTEIAHYCGFYDQSHFIKLFRQKLGFIPKELKKL